MQAVHCLSIAAQHREGERRFAVQVFGFQVGAELDQQVQDVVALPADGEMQRRLTFLKARPAAVERLPDCPPPACGSGPGLRSQIAEKM